MILLPGLAGGQLYRRILEKRDSLPTVPYLLCLVVLRVLLSTRYESLAYLLSNCSYFGCGAFGVYAGAALAIAVMLGDGCCAFVSISLGADRREDAHRGVGNAVVLSAAGGIVLCILYLIFSDEFIVMFGGTVNEFAEKAKEADGFVFGTPVHYAAASGNMTAFLDRLFYSAPKEIFCRKPAAVVTSARRAGTTAAYEQLLKYPGIMEMPIVSSCYWNNVHGSCPEDVQKDEEGLRTMRVLGRNMAWLLRCIDAGTAAGVPAPRQEPMARTNFIR